MTSTGRPGALLTAKPRFCTILLISQKKEKALPGCWGCSPNPAACRPRGALHLILVGHAFSAWLEEDEAAEPPGVGRAAAGINARPRGENRALCGPRTPACSQPGGTGGTGGTGMLFGRQPRW